MKTITSPTKEGLLKAINEFYYSTSYIITESNGAFNTKLNKTLGMVKETKRGFEYHAFEFSPKKDLKTDLK